jgi:Xaa-Pro aminopeptidase
VSEARTEPNPPYAGRRQRLRETLEAHGADALVVTRLVNVRYLSGFTGSNAALLVTPEAAVLATDGRYRTQAGEQSPDVQLLIRRRCAVALTQHATAQGTRRLAFEAHDVTVELHRELARVAGAGTLVDAGRAVEHLRRTKDDDELAALRRACAISDAALGDLLSGIHAGRTELDIARELDRRMLDAGAEAVAFETIVAGGPDSAIPHHTPTSRPVERGDLLKVDFGARFRGYHADMTRTFVVGAEPAGWQREIYDLVARAQAAGRAALAPGVRTADVDAAAREVIHAAGHGEHFPHGLGHGVGLEIHEAPLLGSAAAGILDDRTPVTVEPGVYLPGLGGVRIEDSLVVRDAAYGGPELLTKTAKELVVLG